MVSGCTRHEQAKGIFAGWQGLPLKVDSKAAKSWPPPWLTFAERQSPLTRWKSPRNATNPAQSVLNFCYAMLASQIRTALNAVGADLGCGVLHADLDGRDSLVYDVMEALRGEGDHLILEFVKSHVFGLGDFVAQDSGAVVIHPSLCRVLAEACRLPQRKSDDEARWYRRQLLEVK